MRGRMQERWMGNARVVREECKWQIRSAERWMGNARVVREECKQVRNARSGWEMSG